MPDNRGPAKHRSPLRPARPDQAATPRIHRSRFVASRSPSRRQRQLINSFPGWPSTHSAASAASRTGGEPRTSSRSRPSASTVAAARTSRGRPRAARPPQLLHARLVISGRDSRRIGGGSTQSRSYPFAHLGSLSLGNAQQTIHLKVSSTSSGSPSTSRDQKNPVVRRLSRGHGFRTRGVTPAVSGVVLTAVVRAVVVSWPCR
jgi:hypothetical protein